MTDIKELTDLQRLNLELYRLVAKDTAAAKKAIAFVKGDCLKDELFKDGFAQATGEVGWVARTEKAVQLATEALNIFTEDKG